MEIVTTLIQEMVVEALLSPLVLLVAALVMLMLLSGLGARLLDR